MLGGSDGGRSGGRLRGDPLLACKGDEDLVLVLDVLDVDLAAALLPAEKEAHDLRRPWDGAPELVRCETYEFGIVTRIRQPDAPARGGAVGEDVDTSALAPEHRVLRVGVSSTRVARAARPTKSWCPRGQSWPRPTQLRKKIC